MQKLRYCLLLLLLSYAAGAAEKADASDTTKIEDSPKSAGEADATKSKTEKRDSSDQIASYVEKIKDEPFRPIYRPHHPNQLLTPFQPTTVRYITAPTPASKVYYNKQEQVGGTQYATPQQPTATDGYRGPFNPAAYQVAQPHQQQLQQQSQQHLQQQSPPAPPTSPAPQYTYTYAADPEADPTPTSDYPNVMYARLAPQGPQQQQIQYVIAIPLTYVRQLQQQLTGVPTHASQAYALPLHQTPLPHPAHPPHQPMYRIVGPLARDHKGAYRPVHTPGPVSGEDTPASNPAGYTTQYMHLPASMLHAAAQAAALYHRPRAYQQRLYYAPPQASGEHTYHHQPYQPQPQQQQISFYAYPAAEQQHHEPQPTHQHHHHPQHPQHQQQHQQPHHHPHQHQQQQQQQEQQQEQQQQPEDQQEQQEQQTDPQQQQQRTVVRIGGTKLSAKLTRPQPSTTLTPANAPTAQRFVHYNPVYVQPPPPHPATLQRIFYVRYPQNALPMHLTAPQATHYYAAPQYYGPPQTPATDKMSYSGLQFTPGEYSGLPYFSQPGAVHYGTHLYHGPSQATPTAKLPTSSGRAHPQPSPSPTTTSGAAASETLVKYP